jgi:hypothetical protein
MLQGCLSVDEASDPNSDACMLSRFLLDPDVLYEISVFGLDYSLKGEKETALYRQ